jgi:hypothetical protein
MLDRAKANRRDYALLVLSDTGCRKREASALQSRT